MPKMGESIMEGTILKWHKKAGDKVEKDENILDIATDKVDAEVPASESGVLVEILFAENEVVPVGEVIAKIETAVGEASESLENAPKPKEAQVKEVTAPEPEMPTSASLEKKSGSGAQEKTRFYSPVVMSIAQKEGVSIDELEVIPGTGAGNRLSKTDILSYLANKKASAQSYASTEKRPIKENAPQAESLKHATISHHASERTEIIQMDNIRKLISEHMVHSKRTSAHVTSVSEADVTGLVQLVESRKESFLKANGVKLTFTPFFVDACIKTLKQFPTVNASVDGDKIILKKYINFGIAVALGESGDAGLIVPVIKNADEMNLVGLARFIYELATKARQRKLHPDDIQGGTFTLTNYGTTGNLFGSPIINQPQVAILGTGAIVKRPVVRTLDDGTDAIVVRSIMYLSLSYDHRIIDGALAGTFLQTLVKHLEGYSENSQI
nr:dihydrolipoamide acetyltransferase family protein [Chloroherpeton thalassium]